MTKKKLFNYISAGLFLFVLIGIFLDFYSMYSTGASFWDIGESNDWLRFFTILTLAFSLVGIAVNVIGKFQEFSFFALGFVFSITLFLASLYSTDYSFSIGFYFMFIGSICALALNIVNMFIKDGPLTSNRPNNQYGQYQNQQPMNSQYGQYQNSQPMNSQYGQYQNSQPMNSQYGQYQNQQPMNNQYGQYQNQQPTNNQYNNNFHN